MNLTPQQIIRELGKNTQAQIDITHRIIRQRNMIILAEAGLRGKEADVRGEIFNKKVEIQASKLRDYIKWETWKEDLAFEREKQRLRQMEEKRNLIVDVNNNMKIAFKIMEVETKQLNLPAEAYEKTVWDIEGLQGVMREDMGGEGKDV